MIQGGIASGMGLLYTYFKKKMGAGKANRRQLRTVAIPIWVKQGIVRSI